MNGAMSCLDCFMLMFPPNATRHIVTLTNVQLGEQEGHDDVDIGELVHFLDFYC